MAVGYTGGNGVISQTLTEAWNGSVWSIVSSPNSNELNGSALNGVSCSTANSCVAVGGPGGGSGSQTLIESWNGFSWSIVPSPDASGNGDLTSISCVSGDTCVAVGSYYNGSAQEQTLVESSSTVRRGQSSQVQARVAYRCSTAFPACPQARA